MRGSPASSSRPATRPSSPGASTVSSATPTSAGGSAAPDSSGSPVASPWTRPSERPKRSTSRCSRSAAMRPEPFRGVGPGQTRVIRDVSALDGLAEAWDAIAAPAVSPMQQYAWARACAATFTGRRDLHVVAVCESVGLAVAPLIRRRDRFARVEFLGALELDEPSDVLASDEASLARLAEVLVRSRHPLLLKRIPAESPLVPALLRAYSGRGLVIRRRLSGFPWIPLDAGWSRPEDRLNTGRQSDLRRAQRIAEDLGAVRVEVFSPEPEDLAALLAEAFEVEAAGWKGRQGSALACDPTRQAFFRRYAAAACRRGILRLGFLRIGGRTAAMQLGVEWGGRFWLLKIGFDEAFARCSPGTLLMLEMVRRAAQRGLHAYELLGVSEPWTRMWTNLEHPCVSLRAYAGPGSGAPVVAADLPLGGWRGLIRPARYSDRPARAAGPRSRDTWANGQRPRGNPRTGAGTPLQTLSR